MLSKMLRAASYGATDPYFENVTLLLHGDGTNGAQNNTFTDGSTNNFTITRNGNTTQGTFSPYGTLWSNYFDGTGDYLTAAASSAFDFGTGNFTIEAWVFIAADSALDNENRRMASIFNIDFSTTYYFTFFIIGNSTTTGTGLAIYTSTGGGRYAEALGTIPKNTWLHLAVSKSGTSVYFFLNGAQLGSTATTGGSWGSASYAPTIGRSKITGYFFPLNGYISNLRVLKGTALYTANFTPPASPLVAITNTSLLTCQSNRFIDNSSNAFAITRNGDVSVSRFSPFSPGAAYASGTIGGSAYFDGTGDYLTAPDNTAFDFGTGDFTVEAWVFHTISSGTSQVYVGHNSGGIGLYRNNSGALVVSQASVSDITSGGSIPLSAWTHVAASRSGTSLKIFVNGTAVSTVTNSTNFSATGAFEVAGSGGALLMNGYISDLRVVKGTAVYTAAFTPPTDPLTAITNTSLLLNLTNAAIIDNAMMNDLETVGNAQISTGTKKFGTGALYFDGTGDWLLAPHTVDQLFGTGDFTVECWLYLGATGTARGIVGKGTATTGWLLSTDSSNKVVFSYASSTITSSAALSGSTWYHLAVVRSGTGSNATKIYINGSNDGTGTVSTDFTQTNAMYIGANRTGGDPMNGYIDDLRITKGVARYTAAFTPPLRAFSNR